MTTPLLELRGVSRTFRTGDEEVHALDDVSLTIQSGELVAIMGASGSGKSTLLNIFGCLDTLSSGSFLLAGRDVTHLSRGEAADVRNTFIGFVFQNFHLLPRTSAVENVELPLVYAGVSRRERRQRAVEALTRIGLGSRLHHHPNQLSGGQQQRVAIARALVTRPRLILADEPTGNLDSRTSRDIATLLQEVNREGITVVLVTHDPEMRRYVRRVITMRDGRILSDHPQTPQRAEAA